MEKYNLDCYLLGMADTRSMSKKSGPDRYMIWLSQVIVGRIVEERI